MSPYFEKMNKVRETIKQALQRQAYIKEFHKDDIPLKQHCPKTHAHLTELLGVRDRLEDKLMILLEDPGDIENEYESLSKGVNAINRSMYDLYIVYLRPTPLPQAGSQPAQLTPGISSVSADKNEECGVGSVGGTPVSSALLPNAPSASSMHDGVPMRRASEPIVGRDRAGITSLATPSLPFGKYPHHTYRQAGAVNPAARPIQDTPLTYLEAFGVELKTATAAQHHETRIYQPGYTPGEIRSNIKLILRTIEPQQYLLDFPLRDIPPERMDPRTHMVLHALHTEREKLASSMTACLQDIANEDAPPNPNRDIEREYLQLDKFHNDANRSMYQVYSDGPFIIHDNNFQKYCKPHLRNLPEATAFKLQTIRSNLDHDQPPYRPIQDDPLPAPTVPQFQLRGMA
jgi:hypothetical protein